MPEHKKTANQLLDVMRIIQFSRQTGILIAERSSPMGKEEGRIFFVDGQPTRALGGNYRGLEALNWLQSWGLCYFQFVQTSAKEPETTRLLPSGQPGYNTLDGMSSTIQHQAIQASPHMASTKQPQQGSRQTVPLPRIPQRSLQATNETLVKLDQSHLTRTHRHIFLLVDGTRTPQELSRITGRSIAEINMLLRDLEKTGLIH